MKQVLQELNARFLSGAQRDELEQLLAAIKHHYLVSARDLPSSEAAKKGFRSATTVTARDPTVWEDAVRAAEYLAKTAVGTSAVVLRHAACLTLLGYDMYPRPTDLSLIHI